ncbi:phage major capsid protein [Burkholderia vietnamiensis]|uniref:phage major capsid protein n=1 Tax=Burkholderia vietnamiensis TaxID=60552 RepID=UPI000753A1D2|nr:phage major capsid protein [Burkholderia vietnamiensis]KVR97205.1 phage capsid protein [Burkholderia vietnamiensis]
MSIAEKIKALTARLAQAEAARNELVVKSVNGDVPLTDDEVTQFNAYEKELTDGAEELKRLQTVEKSMAAQAVAVATVSATAVNPVIEVKSNAPKGSSFTRTAMILAKAKGDLSLAKSLAEVHYKDDAVVNGIIKSAVAAGSTTVAAWAGNLVYPETYGGDFIELLYPQTVVGRLSAKKVPFNVRIAGQTGGQAVGWVGEAAPAPVTSAAFNAIFLTWSKVYALSILSDEIIRFSNPAAEALVQADLLKATAQGIDSTFLGSAAAVANVSPAGMMNGAAAVVATGADYESLRKDVQSLLAPAIAANYNLQSAVLVMSPARALAIGSMLTPLGVLAFPNLTMDGGFLMGIKVITSNNVSGSVIQLLIQDEIFLSEDAGPQIDISREASIIMDTNPAGASSTPVSMFQNGLVAIRIGQFINWAKRRNLAAAQITGAAYGS